MSKAKKTTTKRSAKATKKVRAKAVTAAKKTAKSVTATKKNVKAVTTAVKADAAEVADVTEATGVSRETLNGTVGRAVTLLRAIGTGKEINAAMASVGYDAAEHQQGWNLVHAASGFAPEGSPSAQDAGATAAAIARIDASDEDAFRIVRATLARRFPAQAKFVLTGIGPSKGAESVVGMRKLLERLDALEGAEDRAATRTEDHAALALLAKRGISAAWRTAMRGDVRDAEKLTPTAPAPVTTTSPAKPDDDHVADLEALRVWFEEWSDLAHVAIKRRDMLIRMGLAKRKAPKKGDPKGGDPKKGGGTA
ncbi:MAG: hypothetical protein U0326_33095 [Polyangiales bacterium]